MQSKTSFFNPTLFCKNITRFWPIWSLYLLFWSFSLPIYLLLNNFTGMSPNYIPYYIYTTLHNGGVVVTLGAALLAAMAVFSYLYNARSVQLLHSLPVKRSCLFITNYLSGLSFLLVPLWITGGMTLLVQATAGHGSFGTTLLWMLLASLLALFFYSFAVFCAMFTGHILALPAFYFILNFLASGLYLVLTQLFSQFVYGFRQVTWLSALATWFSPALRLFSDLTIHYNYSDSTLTADATMLFGGIPTVLLYGLVGIVLAGLALYAYRKRKLESAGDVVSIRWVKPIFKYGVAFCCAVFFGSLLHDIFDHALPDGMVSLLICLLIAGAAGCLVGDMLLKKSFKVLRSGWKGVVAFSLVLTIAAVGMEFDVLGFARLPNPAAISSVTLRGFDTYPQDGATRSDLTLTSPEDIATVLELHRLVVDAKGAPARAASSPAEPITEAATTPAEPITEAATTSAVPTGDDNPYAEDTRTIWLQLDYTMDNGETLYRAYDIVIYAEDLETPGTVPYLLNKLINRPALYTAYYFHLLPANAALVDAYIDLFNTTTGDYEAVSLGSEVDRNRLLQALRQDMQQGNLGYRFLFNDSEARQRACAVGDIILNFYVPPQSISSGASGPSKDDGATWTVPVTPQITATATISLLTELGIIDDTHLLLTHTDNPSDYLTEQALQLVPTKN